MQLSPDSRVLGALVLALGAATVAAAPSLVIQKDGTRRLGDLRVDGAILTCATSYGDIRLTLGQVAEIVGPHSDLVEVTPGDRRRHRLPDLGRLLARVIGGELEGDPEGLEVMITDERWEIWAPPGKKKEAREVHRHLKKIINKMKAYFPRGQKPERPCRVRLFQEMEPFLAWRDRGQDLPVRELMAAALTEFYTAEDSVMIADLGSPEAGVAGKVDAFRIAVKRLVQGARNQAEVITANLLLVSLAEACASGRPERIARALDWVIHYRPGVSKKPEGAPEPTDDDPAPAVPGEEGEATFINYGYYMAATEELVVWESSEKWPTLSHECFHYWLEHNCPDAPIWIDEGFATYFETFLPNKRDKYQGFHFARFQELKSARERGVPYFPLADLLVLPHGVWQAQEGPLQSYLYAQSWAFIHFLLNHEDFEFGDKGEKLLKKYLTSLAEGATAAEARDEHFSGDYELERMETLFQHYLRRLKDPSR